MKKLSLTEATVMALEGKLIEDDIIDKYIVYYVVEKMLTSNGPTYSDSIRGSFESKENAVTWMDILRNREPRKILYS